MFFEVILPMLGGLATAGTFTYAMVFAGRGAKCILCGKRGPLKSFNPELDMAHPNWGWEDKLDTVTWVKEYGVYGRSDKYAHWYYHPSCVETVLCQPEVHGHGKVDKALGIMERVAQQRDRIDQARMDKIRAALWHKATVKLACRKAKDGFLLLD